MDGEGFRSLSRRVFLGAGAAAFAGGLKPAAHAQEPSAATYPSRPIRIVIGFGPGGLADISMRLLAEKLAARLGQPVIIENRPGAGGTLAAQSVLSSAADGYTIAVLTTGTAISASLLRSMPFDPTKDFLPVSSVAFYDLLLLVAADSPIRTLDDLLADARRRGGAMTIATINRGSSQNLAAELFKTTAGIEATIVPYRTTPEVHIAVSRGDAVVAVETYAALRGPINDGVLRAVVSTGPTRSLPEVPTARESGLAYEVVGWNALFVKAGTPPPIIARLNAAVVDALAAAELRQRILDLGTEPRSMVPEALGTLMRDDIGMWADIVTRAGLKNQQ